VRENNKTTRYEGIVILVLLNSPFIHFDQIDEDHFAVVYGMNVLLD